MAKMTNRSVPKPRTAPYVAVYATKGGVGKTEIVRHIAYQAIAEKQKIIVFDVDSQSDSSTLLLPSGVKLNPMRPDFERTEYVLVTKNNRDVLAYPDRVVIADCPPQRESVQMLDDIATFWIIPVGTDDREVHQSISLANRFKSEKRRFAFVLSRWNSNSEYAKDYISALFAAGPILGVILHWNNVAVDEARVNHLPISEIDTDLGDLYERVGTWVLEGCPLVDEWIINEHDLKAMFDVDDFEAIREQERVRYA